MKLAHTHAYAPYVLPDRLIVRIAILTLSVQARLQLAAMVTGLFGENDHHSAALLRPRSLSHPRMLTVEMTQF